MTVAGTLYTTTYSVTAGHNLTIIFGGHAGETCTISAILSGVVVHKKAATTIPGTYPEENILVVPDWGSTWAVGTYTLSTTCTLAGYPNATATQIATITP